MATALNQNGKKLHTDKARSKNIQVANEHNTAGTVCGCYDEKITPKIESGLYLSIFDCTGEGLTFLGSFTLPGAKDTEHCSV